jgi:hypothetical protein
MTTAECHHLLDNLDTGLIRDYPAGRRFNAIKGLNDSSGWNAGCLSCVEWFRPHPKRTRL